MRFFTFLTKGKSRKAIDNDNVDLVIPVLPMHNVDSLLIVPTDRTSCLYIPAA